MRTLRFLPMVLAAATLLLLSAGWSSPVHAQGVYFGPRHLNGTYNFGGGGACTVSDAPLVNLQPQPSAGRWSSSWGMTGSATFHANGTGVLNGHLVYVVAADNGGSLGGSGDADVYTPFNYSIAADGTIVFDMYGITLTHNAGFRAGQTAQISDVVLTGNVSAAGLVIQLASQSAVPETVTYSGGPNTEEYRTCWRTRTFVK